MTPQKGEFVFLPQIMEDYAPIKVDSAKSYLVRLEEGKSAGFWVAKSQVEWQASERGYEGTLPEWLVDKIEIKQNIDEYER